jgi:hypothetical protein
LRRRLRRLLERPISDNERVSAFGLAVLLVLASCVALLLTREHHPRPRPPAATAPAPAAPEPYRPTAPPPPDPGASAEPPAQAPPAAAVRSARRFLAGYLRYLYGHGRARQIRSATLRLRRRLAAHPPRVSPATRQRRPRIVQIEGSATGRQRWTLTARIADGSGASYPLALEVAQRPGGFVVTRLEGDR